MTTFEERHGRPKPPEIIGASYVDYARRHNTLMVYKDSFPGRWCVWLHGRGFKFFPSHAEAIQYAQAQARKDPHMTAAWERTNRPKPPQISSLESIEYCTRHGITVVFKSIFNNGWISHAPTAKEARHDTHAEAIDYADKLAHERNQE